MGLCRTCIRACFARSCRFAPCRTRTDLAQIVDTRVAPAVAAAIKQGSRQLESPGDFEYYVHYVDCALLRRSEPRHGFDSRVHAPTAAASLHSRVSLAQTIGAWTSGLGLSAFKVWWRSPMLMELG